MQMAIIHIQRCEQSSALNSPTGQPQMLISRLWFDLEINGMRHPGLSVHVNQVLSSDRNSSAVEVAEPIGYNGPMDQEAFKNGIERYYRRLMRDEFLIRESDAQRREKLPRIFDNLSATFSFAIGDRVESHIRGILH